MFLAVVLTSTSAGLLLPLLKDAGEHRPPFGPLVMAAAALAEVVPVMMLSLLFSASSTTQAARLSSLAALLALLAVIGLALGRVRNLGALDRLLDRLEDRSAQLRVRAALTLALAFAWLAARFGFASILGAFAAGLLVRTIDLTNRAPHPQFQIKLEGIGFGFLVPVFFITTGAQFDARALVSDPAALAEVPLFLLALLVVRGLPALAYARLIGKRPGRRAGLMQATTLTFVIVATQIGLASGQVSQATGAALLAAGLLSATIFPAAAVKLLAAVSLSTTVWPRTVWPRTVWPRTVWPRTVWPRLVLGLSGGRRGALGTRHRRVGRAAQQPQGRRRINDDRQQARHHQGGGRGRPLVTGLHPDDGRHHDERQGRGLHETSGPGAGAPDGPDVQHGRRCPAPPAAPPGTPARERSPWRWRTRRTRPGRAGADEEHRDQESEADRLELAWSSCWAAGDSSVRRTMTPARNAPKMVASPKRSAITAKARANVMAIRVRS